MTDDLVKRLREYAIHMDAWGKEATHDADIVDKAADRIEKLEAALREIAESAWDCTGDTCDHCKPDNCPNRDIARIELPTPCLKRERKRNE
jgi:hypothetical protein